MYVQVDPGGQVSVHLPPSQLYNSFHLLHQCLVLPMPNVIFLLSHKEEEEGFTQREEGRQVFHRQLRLKQNIKNKEDSLKSKTRQHYHFLWALPLIKKKNCNTFTPMSWIFTMCTTNIHIRSGISNCKIHGKQRLPVYMFGFKCFGWRYRTDY